MVLRNLEPIAIVGTDCACGLRRAKTPLPLAALPLCFHLQLDHTRHS